MSFDPKTLDGQLFKIGQIVRTEKFGGKIIMIVKLADLRYQYTLELPCNLYVISEKVF